MAGLDSASEDTNGCPGNSRARYGENTSVTDFYEGKGVFITGGTGFVGKVLIEKLLRSTNVKYVFVLLRSKNGRGPNERINEITSSKCFRKLSTDNPSVLDKIIAINGDICFPGLGLSRLDREMLLRSVSVVFHSAAEVRFVEPLRVAFEINVMGTRRVLKFCKELPLIEAFVHVSTAYANCHKKEVEERIYEISITYQDLHHATNWLSDGALESLQPLISDGRPNSYTFTKALGETVLAKEGDGIPICIVRPSIVVGAYKEPLPGWIEGTNGPTGLTAVLSKGVLRTALVDLSLKLDVIPVDFVVNLLIVAGWRTAKDKPKTPTVYNLTSGNINPFTLDMIRTYVLDAIYRNPCRELYRYPGCRFRSSPIMHKFDMVIDHYVPGFIADILAPLIGYNPGMMKLYKKVNRELEIMRYFYSNEWVFRGEKVDELRAQLCPKEKEIFYFDVSTINWEECSNIFVTGIREFILKEDPSTISKGKVVLRRWYIVQKAIDLVTIGALAKIGLAYYDVFVDYFYAIFNSVKCLF